MKTSTPKSQVEGKPSETKGGYFALTINLSTLFVAISIAYLMLYPIEHESKNDAEYHVAQLRQWSEVSKSLADMKAQLAEVRKSSEKGDANWEKMSKDYHIGLLAGIIKNKLIAGDDFKSDLEELGKFGVSQKDPNLQALQKYASYEPVKVRAIIGVLFDEATSNNKEVGGGGFIDSVKHFFANLFTIKKLDEHKVHATSNEVTAIIVQLLLDGRIEAAYMVASKFSGAHANITRIADTLKPLNEALNAVSKLEVYG